VSPGNSSKSCITKYLKEKQRFTAGPHAIKLDAHILALVILWARAAPFWAVKEMKEFKTAG
jgi:hypothetical protein